MKKELFKYPESGKGYVDDFYQEIFHDREYDRYGAKVGAGDVVIDCGAFVGMFTHFALLKGAKQVYSVELEPSHYESLVENTINCPNVKTYLGEVKDNVENENQYTIKRIMEENDLQYVDFVKMDIEGAEFPTLINMEDEVMRRVNKWAIEFHIGWDKDNTQWSHGRDFNAHYTSKLLYIMGKFSRNGFKLGYEHIHENYNIVMLYAWK